MKILIVMFIAVGVCTADVSHIISQDPYAVPLEYHTTTTTTPPPPPHPYVFAYTAGRFPGHVDRTHSEVSDGSGTVRGAFSYVDPRLQVRTVEYVADQYGFHPILSHEPQGPVETEAVQKAAQRHFSLYNRIAEAHAHHDPNLQVVAVPRDSAAVAHAKEKHLSLYEKIAAEHARIGAEQEAQRLAFEATSVPNDIEEYHKLH
ncbi:larval cuticle protein LCP-17 [Lutzomyia longipalpis]|uniref:Putative cuticular protein 9 rr-1 family n=1 Tax=Lutzomyia longipalpis TaxID=7200 RepID=A0A7G3AAD0_LUTLO|nr:larval cuticle protein LCP-17 [Lutzomyia longipalpis]